MHRNKNYTHNKHTSLTNFLIIFYCCGKEWHVFLHDHHIRQRNAKPPHQKTRPANRSPLEPTQRRRPRGSSPLNMSSKSRCTTASGSGTAATAVEAPRRRQSRSRLFPPLPRPSPPNAASVVASGRGASWSSSASSRFSGGGAAGTSPENLPESASVRRVFS